DLRRVRLARVSADLRNLANISPSLPPTTLPPTTLPPTTLPPPSALVQGAAAAAQGFGASLGEPNVTTEGTAEAAEAAGSPAADTHGDTPSNAEGSVDVEVENATHLEAAPSI